jgi:archaellum component FlaF (FlaF/FlaG flagellin family)
MRVDVISNASAMPQAKALPFCTECGTPLTVDARFCLSCGTPITPSGMPQVAVSTPHIKVSQTKRNVAVVAVVLLILVLAGTAYAYKPSPIIKLSTASGKTTILPTQQSREMMIMEAYSWITATGTITLTFRNVGSVPIDASHTNVFLSGIPVNGGLGTGCDVTLTAGQGCTATFSLPSETYVVGTAYQLKLVTPDGAVFSYSVIAGYSG